MLIDLYVFVVLCVCDLSECVFRTGADMKSII